MKRQITYKGITIETNIQLNYRAERGLNGRKWHKITIKTISDKVDEKFESSDEILSTVENSTILALCEHNEIKAKDFIDKTEIEQFFIQNGFVK